MKIFSKTEKEPFIFNAVQRIDFITHYERTLRMLTHVVNACLTAFYIKGKEKPF
jgi:hypothetical protein